MDDQSIELLFKAVAGAMPTDDFSEDDPEIRFVKAGCELILKSVDEEPTMQEACESEEGVWFCYFWKWDATCRLIVRNGEISVQATVDDWETCSSEYVVTDRIGLRFDINECIIDEARTEHNG
jgi:hypothetical protein